MSAVPQLRALGGVISLGAILTLTALLPYTRQLLTSKIGYSLPKGTWRSLAIIFVLLNLKSLPLVWHVSTQTSITPKPATSPSHFQQKRKG